MPRHILPANWTGNRWVRACEIVLIVGWILVESATATLLVETVAVFLTRPELAPISVRITFLHGSCFFELLGLLLIGPGTIAVGAVTAAANSERAFGNVLSLLGFFVSLAVANRVFFVFIDPILSWK